MKEIAEAAGVSISTVSLVLNGRDAGRVKAPLAALIREKADELGYTVNPLARSYAPAAHEFSVSSAKKSPPPRMQAASFWVRRMRQAPTDI